MKSNQKLFILTLLILSLLLLLYQWYRKEDGVTTELGKQGDKIIRTWIVIDRRSPTVNEAEKENFHRRVEYDTLKIISGATSFVGSSDKYLEVLFKEDSLFTDKLNRNSVVLLNGDSTYQAVANWSERHEGREYQIYLFFTYINVPAAVYHTALTDYVFYYTPTAGVVLRSVNQAKLSFQLIKIQYVNQEEIRKTIYVDSTYGHSRPIH